MDQLDQAVSVVKQEVKQEATEVQEPKKSRKKPKNLVYLSDDELDEDDESARIYTGKHRELGQSLKSIEEKAIKTVSNEPSFFENDLKQGRNKKDELSEVMELINDVKSNKQDGEIKESEDEVEVEVMKKKGKKKKRRGKRGEKDLMRNLNQLGEFVETMSALDSSTTFQDEVNESLKIIEEVENRPVEREMKIMVKFNGNVGKFTVDVEEKFGKLMAAFGEHFKEDPANLVIYFKEKPVKNEDSASSLGITITDILDCYRSAIDSKTDKEQSNLLTIKVKDNSRDQPEIFQVKMHDKFLQLMVDYAKLKSRSIENINFYFDGDKLEADKTPVDYDMEDESQIDVVFG